MFILTFFLNPVLFILNQLKNLKNPAKDLQTGYEYEYLNHNIPAPSVCCCEQTRFSLVHIAAAAASSVLSGLFVPTPFEEEILMFSN